MNVAWLAALGLLLPTGNGDAAGLCKIDGADIYFLKEVRFIPYDALLVDEKWAHGEVKGRYPIANMFGHIAGHEEGPFLVAGFAADPFPASLEVTERPYRFKLLGIRWGAIQPGIDEFADATIKYSAATVSYVVDFSEAKSCQGDATVNVDVIASGTLVEKIHFKVVDMTNVKDYWFDERK